MDEYTKLVKDMISAVATGNRYKGFSVLNELGDNLWAAGVPEISEETWSKIPFAYMSDEMKRRISQANLNSTQIGLSALESMGMTEN